MPAKKKSARKAPARRAALKKAARPGPSRKSEPKMLSIWFFVGLMLAVLGVIVAAMGVYYVFKPQRATVLANLNPSLWWGGIILVAGLIFLIPSWKRYKAGK